MLFRPPRSIKKSFRDAAVVGAVTLAAVSFAANSSFATEPTTKANFTAACASVKDANKHAGCMLDALNKDTARLKAEESAANARGAAADARGTAADARGTAADARAAKTDDMIACMKDLGKFKDRSPEGFAKLGTITPQNACAAAAKIPPRPTASLN